MDAYKDRHTDKSRQTDRAEARQQEAQTARARAGPPARERDRSESAKYQAKY